MQVAELLHVVLDVLAALIALTALPETEGPLRIKRSLAGKRTVTGNHLIEILTGDEIIVHIRRHFTPDAQLVLLCLRTRSCYAKSAVGNITIWLPLDTDRSLYALLDWSFKLIRVRIPGCTPALRNYQFTVDINLHVTGIIEDKLIEAVGWSLHITLVHHLGTIQREALWQVLNTALVGLVANLRSLRHCILKVNAIFASNNLLTVLVYISTCQLTFLTILIIEFEGTVELEIIFRITPTAIRIRIPEDAIVFIRDDERHTHLGIILEEVFVLTLHVEFLTLMLTETIKRLVIRRVEERTP